MEYKLEITRKELAGISLKDGALVSRSDLGRDSTGLTITQGTNIIGRAEIKSSTAFLDSRNNKAPLFMLDASQRLNVAEHQKPFDRMRQQVMLDIDAAFKNENKEEALAALKAIGFGDEEAAKLYEQKPQVMLPNVDFTGIGTEVRAPAPPTIEPLSQEDRERAYREDQKRLQALGKSEKDLPPHSTYEVSESGSITYKNPLVAGSPHITDLAEAQIAHNKKAEEAGVLLKDLDLASVVEKALQFVDPEKSKDMRGDGAIDAAVIDALKGDKETMARVKAALDLNNDKEITHREIRKAVGTMETPLTPQSVSALEAAVGVVQTPSQGVPQKKTER